MQVLEHPIKVAKTQQGDFETRDPETSDSQADNLSHPIRWGALHNEAHSDKPSGNYA